MRAVVLAALAACGSHTTPTEPPAPPMIDAGPTAAEDLAEARALEASAFVLREPADKRLAWLVAAAAWDRVVEDGALPRPALRDAAWHALVAIRLVRPPEEIATRGGAPPAHVTREIAAIDRHVALLDEPDGADGLTEQFQAATLLVTWGELVGAAPRLAHILGVRRDLDITPLALDLLVATLIEIRDGADARRWVVTVGTDRDYAARFPDSAAHLRDEMATFELEDAQQQMDRGDFVGCAAAFEHVAATAPADADVARFDEAICFERAGRTAPAIEIYRDLASGAASRPLAVKARQRLRELELNAP